MITFQDLSYTQYLDALAAEYLEQQGLLVHYQPFVYGADFLPLAASATQTFRTVIDHDADFVFIMQTFSSVAAGVNEPAPNVLALQITETSGRRLQDRPTLIPNLFGTGLRPAIWPKPFVLPARSTLTLQLQDLSAVARDIRFSYIGCKAFVSPAAGPPGGDRATGRSAGPTLY